LQEQKKEHLKAKKDELETKNKFKNQTGKGASMNLRRVIY
jgi:hypothetical protein